MGIEQLWCEIKGNSTLKFFKSRKKKKQKAGRSLFAGCDSGAAAACSLTEGDAGCLQASTPILSLPFLFHGHAHSCVPAD